jgi:hypothetical protein
MLAFFGPDRPGIPQASYANWRLPISCIGQTPALEREEDLLGHCVLRPRIPAGWY